MIGIARTHIGIGRINGCNFRHISSTQLNRVPMGFQHALIKTFTTTRNLKARTSHQAIKPIVPTTVEIDTTVKPSSNSISPEEREASRLARLAGLGWLSKLPEKWIPYAELIRIEKPVGTLLLLTPSLWGITMASYAIAAPLTTTLPVVGLFTIGAFIMRGAGCTINDILDRNLDNKVARTMERPIASGRVSVPQAVTFLGVQCFAGLAVLLSLPFECFYLGAASLPLIFSYPLFKRYTFYPQFWFSLCFSWACLLGYPAVGAPLDLWVALPLFVSNWCWGIIYDTVYAHQDKKFDIHAGVKSTALAWGDKSKTYMNRLLVGQAGTFALAGYMNAMGPGFYIMGALAIARIAKKLKEVDLDDPKACWSFFVDNIKNGFILWFGMVIDYALKISGFL